MLNTSNIEKSITKLKAAWKGKQTRSILLETRCEFEEIFNEIEQQFNTDSIIEWTSNNLCYPKIIGTKKSNSACNNNFSCKNKKELDFEKKKNRENSDNNTKQKDTDKRVIKDDGPSGDHSTKSRSHTIQPTIAESPSSEYVTQLVNDMTEKVLTCNSVSGSLETNTDDIVNNSPSDCTTHDSNTNKNERSNTGSGESVIPGAEQHRDSDQNRDSVELQFDGSLVDPLEFVETSSCIEATNKNNRTDKHNLLTDSWVTDKSFEISPSSSNNVNCTDNKSEGELLKMKENLSMELLWISQAITSRKAYLKMKNSS